MRRALEFAAPQAITGGRALLGAWAMFLAIQNDIERAAIVLILGLITDRLDGLVAKRLQVASEFGYMFDCFTDYLYYVVVPSVLAFRLAGSPASGLVLAALLAPFLTGAIRYARNIGLSRTQSFDRSGFPGLPTLVFAFYIVALVFLRRERELAAGIMPPLLGITVPLFAVLMVSPLRYPKLAMNPWFLLIVTVGLNIMPFAFTAPLAWATIALGSLYILAAPLTFRGRQQEEAPCPSVRKS